MIPRSRLFDLLIVRSWWVILFCLICLMLFDITLRHRQMEQKRLLKKLHAVQDCLISEKKRCEQLKAELVSQHDQAWLELVLMRNLGVIPEGTTKLIIAPQQQDSDIYKE